MRDKKLIIDVLMTAAIGVILTFFINNNLWGETLSAEEEEIIKKLDLYEDYTFWGEGLSSGDNGFSAAELQNITEEEWKMLKATGDELLDYDYKKDAEGGEKDEE